MSKKRKKPGEDINKFRVFLNNIHADESELPDFDEDEDLEADDREPKSIDSEVIDIEARVVVDPSALPFAKSPVATPKALPAAPGIQVSSETSAKPKAQSEAQTEPDPKTSRSPGRPRKLNAKPKNTNNGQRGRPATGKRSNNEWQGRTFYVRKQTDDVLTSALFKLKRSGIALDKSELVDALLEAWAEVTLGDISDFQIGEIVENKLKKP
jgi:hypothetical protein